MKRILGFVVCCAVGVGVYIWFTNQEKPFTQQEQSPTPTVTKQKEVKKTITIENTTYTYAILPNVSPSEVKLFSNLPQKKSTLELKSEHSCTSLTSAGFYDTNDAHIGLFIVDDVVLQKQSSNSLFNYLVWKTKTGSLGISQQLPDEPIAFALQTGPLLIDQGSPRVLRLRVDEQARRIAVGRTSENQFIFYAVYGEDNTFTGPTLVDLPAVLAAINKQEQLAVPTVVNLDGGNHSAFISPDTSIQEFVSVGGLFCID